eukprot:TRINITY_DN12525_c0_g1_i1.p2 TRINITY_DN12525_c0_g1~~TRINITY_DN12525_c0_g1_i1.p2  ORF type:complete len:223 (-),score=-20.18 TRINITY_DN12525_c0_g1_i1:432-1100(-)
MQQNFQVILFSKKFMELKEQEFKQYEKLPRQKHHQNYYQQNHLNQFYFTQIRRLSQFNIIQNKIITLTYINNQMHIMLKTQHEQRRNALIVVTLQKFRLISMFFAHTQRIILKKALFPFNKQTGKLTIFSFFCNDSTIKSQKTATNICKVEGEKTLLTNPIYHTLYQNKLFFQGLFTFLILQIVLIKFSQCLLLYIFYILVHQGRRLLSQKIHQLFLQVDLC